MTKYNKLRLNNYLQHILEAIDRISEYTKDLNEQTFLDNKLIQDAVIRNVEIIGEACRNLERHYPEFSKTYSTLPVSIR